MRLKIFVLTKGLNFFLFCKLDSKFTIAFKEEVLKDFLDKIKKIASKKEDLPAPFFPRIKLFFPRLNEELLNDLKLFKCIFEKDIPS